MGRRDDSDAACFKEAERLFAAHDPRGAADIWASLKSNAAARFNAGNAYRDAGDATSAIANYRAALELYESDAFLNLAFVLLDEGRDEEALMVLQQGAAFGDAQSAVQLAFEVLKSDPSRAEALSAPYADSVSVLGVRATIALAKARSACNTDDTTINILLDASVPLEARIFVADFLADVGRDREAIQIYTGLLDANVKEAGVPLGNLLLKGTDAEGAERAYWRGAQLGDPFARFNLGVLLVDQDQSEEGVRLIREAAEHGDDLARTWLQNEAD